MSLFIMLKSISSVLIGLFMIITGCNIIKGENTDKFSEMLMFATFALTEFCIWC